MLQISGSGVCGQGKEWGEGGENPDPSNLIIKQNLIFNYLIFRRFFSIIVCRFVVLISLAIHDASVTRYA